ncbi:hypothetical protein Agub_g3240, partial [Astrephomene gubernaculifera]
QRFCQQCGKFQDLSDFDGSKRSCRAQLARHSLRRRIKLSQLKTQENPGDIDGGSDNAALAVPPAAGSLRQPDGAAPQLPLAPTLDLAAPGGRSSTGGGAVRLTVGGACAGLDLGGVSMGLSLGLVRRHEGGSSSGAARGEPGPPASKGPSREGTSMGHRHGSGTE